MLGSRRTCILLCLVELTISGGRIHYEADFYSTLFTKEKRKEAEVWHLGASFLNYFYIPSICSTTFKTNVVSVYLQLYNAGKRTMKSAIAVGKNEEM